MKKSLLIIGAGCAGTMVANEIRYHGRLSSEYEICGFLDDNPSKTDVDGIPVIDAIENAREVVEAHNIDEVIIAIPSASREVMSRIIDSLSGVRARIRIVPGIYEIIEGDVKIGQVRDIKAEDLLGREEVGFDIEEIDGFYRDKSVFITGGGGSIGGSILFEVMKLPVKKIIAFGRGEFSIHSVLQKVSGDKRFSHVIGDIRDKDKIVFELKRFAPDILFHTAAYKHVPLMEDFPEEAVKNNIIGTYNTAISAIECGVGRFVLLSTDKAVNPSSVMGATKRVAERIVLSLNYHQDKTRFSLVRFGNVISSRGSVVPIFEEQIKCGGPVTITHPDVTRFFMSLREAARLVIKSATFNNGAIFVLDMGKPVKIAELAQRLIRLYGYDDKNFPVVFVGMRPGDKMFEEVLADDTNLIPSKYKKLLISGEEDGVLSADELNVMIERFGKASSACDRDAVMSLLKEYVPEYGGIK
jgi:FlaA1/EpsC-like NDP-sugar epimerase